MYTLEEVADRYAALERHVHTAVRVLSGAVCADCEAPCCHPRHCASLAESAWLRLVASRAGVDVAPPTGTDDGAVFLGPDGCRLEAGRPLICTRYVCDRLNLELHDPLDRYVYEVLSEVLGYVDHGAAGREALTELTDLGALGERRLVRLAERIRTAERCVEICGRLIEERGDARLTRATAADLLFLARTLPYAARAIRFSGEPPNLSQRGRERLAKGAST